VVVVSSVALLAAAVLAFLAFWGRLPWPVVGRAGTWFLAGLTALALWAGASLFWSIQADRSWDSANLALAYVAFAVVGLFVGVRVVAAVLAAAIGLSVSWGLLGRVIPTLAPQTSTARVTGTIDYWNAFALMAASALPLGLWLASSARWRVRIAGLLLMYGGTIALLLTFSRGGLVVAAVAVGVWLVLVRERLESLGLLAVAVVPALGAALVAFALPGVSSDREPRSVRVHDGPVFGVAVLVGAAVVVGVAWWLREHPLTLSGAQKRRVWRWLLLVVPVGLLVVIALGVVASAGPLTIHAGPGRFFRLGSSDRVQWWKESLDIWRDRPLAGSGAGTFSTARLPYAGDTSFASEPHNLPLQFLSELGVIGLALFALVLVSAGFVVACAVRRLRGAERSAAVALAAICAAYLAHAVVEFDWEYVALTGPVVLVVASLAAAGREAHRRAPRRLLAIAAVVVVVVALYSVATPWAADRRLNDAADLLSANRYSASADAAKDAHTLNPLSAEALIAWGDAENALALHALDANRDDDARAYAEQALRRYRQATDLQPENPLTWLALGRFQLETLGQKEAAQASLERAVALDPRSEEAQSLLDEATGRG
jgi:hypothetical protein